MAKKISFRLLLCFTFVLFASSCYAAKHVHQYENHICTQCGEAESGLYYNGEYKFSWQELIDRGYITESMKYYGTTTIKRVRSLDSCSSTLVGDLVVDEGIVLISGSLSGNKQGFAWTQLNSIKLPSTVKEIYYGAFRGSSISEVSLNEGLEKLGDDMFRGCINLTTVELPSTLKEIGSYTFSGCTGLQSVIFHGTDLIVHEQATFIGCSSLINVDLHRFMGIGHDMFKNCTALETITLPENITYIGDKAFEGCTNLQTVIMSDSVTRLGSYSFNGCTSLLELYLSDSITEISEYAFSSCSSLKTVYFGHATKELQNSIFYETPIENLYLPKSLLKVHRAIFLWGSWGGDYEPEINVYYEGDEFDWLLVDKSNPLNNAYIEYNVTY